jgi:hypothetical protein
VTTAYDILVTGATPLPVVEAALGIHRALVSLGQEADVVEDRLPAARPGRITVTLAPHDVYPHLGAKPDALEQHLERAVLISTARPSALAWTTTLRYATAALAVLDVSDAGVSAFATAGLPVQRFRLGYDPALDRGIGGVDTRPIDVVFLGTSTPRRLRLIAAAAPYLSRHDTDLRFVDAVASRLEPVDGFVAGEEKLRLLGRSKIVMNLHPDDDPLFEWLRAYEALANGCLLVSELSSGATPLDPGRHFVSVDHGHLGPTIDRLLAEPERLEEIRATGAAFFRDGVRLEDSARAIVEAADAGTARPRKRAPALAPQAPTPTPADPDEQPALDPVHAAVMRQNAVLKRLFVEIRGLRREVAHVRHAVEEPGAPLVAATATPGWDAGTPADISVIISLYNYGRFVRSAIESALASEGVATEVIVIDDRSTDDGPAVVRSVMDERPDAAILFLEQHVNTGVQRARNLAFERARAPLAFVLDADNLVYARGLAKLREGLLRDPDAAFAYGIIERFSEAGSLGLMGLEGWDERRLARSHYIDAMALVRVDAWREVGGYVTDPSLELGWEDYDLWLNFASHGYRGVHVREIVGRYRVHGVSSLAITTLDVDDLRGRLQARHARFFQTVSGEDGATDS